MENKKSKLWLLIGVLVVIAAVVVGIFALKPEKVKENPYFIIETEDEMYIVDAEDENPEPVLIDEIYNETWYSVPPVISSDNKKVVYVNNKIEIDGNNNVFELYSYDIETKEKTLIAEDVSAYATDKDLTEFVYFKGNTGDVYRKNGDTEEKIFDNVSIFYMTDDGNKVVLETKNDEVYLAVKGEETELVGTDMSIVDFDKASGDFVYKQDNKFAKYEAGEEKLITDNVGDMIRHSLDIVCKNGYVDVNTIETEKMDLFIDDLDTADIDITETQKEAIRKRVSKFVEENDQYQLKRYSLKYYDGDNVTDVIDNVTYNVGVCSDAADDHSVAIYEVMDTLPEIKLSEIYDKNEEELWYVFFGAIDEMSKNVLLKDGKVLSELDFNVYQSYYDTESETMYLIESTDMMIDDIYTYKNIRKVSLAGDTLGEMEIIANKINTDSYNLIGSDLYYLVYEDEENDLYKNDELLIDGISGGVESIDYIMFTDKQGESIIAFTNGRIEQVGNGFEDYNDILELNSEILVLRSEKGVVVYKGTDNYKTIKMKNSNVEILNTYDLDDDGVSINLF